MTNTTYNTCCMCGKETKTRCPRCAAEGIDVFFCSTDHQKLAWSTHKLVCGSKSNPFTLPPLTDEEADFVWTHRRFASEQIAMITMGALPATPLKLLEERCAVKEDGMRDVLSALSRDEPASQDIEAQRFELLRTLRVYIFCQQGELLHQRRIAMGDAYTRPNETTAPIQSLSMKLMASEWQQLSEGERKKRWFSELSHRLLAYGIYARIWPVHKFFCGPKACPLVWPDLTTAEADAAWKQRTWCDDTSEAIHYEDRIPITSAFKQIIGIEENELQNVLQSLTGKGEVTPTVAARRQALVK
ncbi:hypothetical protein OF846_001931 [Rhodotorula toruloides]|nr:hypothetical protein OF846_001931 [Rhodotorula toruloides]